MTWIVRFLQHISPQTTLTTPCLKLSKQMWPNPILPFHVVKCLQMGLSLINTVALQHLKTSLTFSLPRSHPWGPIVALAFTLIPIGQPEVQTGPRRSPQHQFQKNHRGDRLTEYPKQLGHLSGKAIGWREAIAIFLLIRLMMVHVHCEIPLGLEWCAPVVLTTPGQAGTGSLWQRYPDHRGRASH